MGCAVVSILENEKLLQSFIYRANQCYRKFDASPAVGWDDECSLNIFDLVEYACSILGKDHGAGVIIMNER